MRRIASHFLAKIEWLSPICDVYIGETLDLFSSLNWIHKLNLRPIDFELNSKREVDSFHMSL